MESGGIDLKKLLEESTNDFKSPIINGDQQEIDLFDVDQLNDDSDKLANDTINNLKEYFIPEKVLNAQPFIRDKILRDITSLKMLFKMSKANNLAHDAILTKISSGESGNASLYASLCKIQTTSLDLLKRIDETVSQIQRSMTNIQLELNMSDEDIEDDDTKKSSTEGNAIRGNRDLIIKLQENKEQENDE